jgi:hypothetical protein
MPHPAASGKGILLSLEKKCAARVTFRHPIASPKVEKQEKASERENNMAGFEVLVFVAGFFAALWTLDRWLASGKLERNNSSSYDVTSVPWC